MNVFLRDEGGGQGTGAGDQGTGADDAGKTQGTEAGKSQGAGAGSHTQEPPQFTDVKQANDWAKEHLTKLTDTDKRVKQLESEAEDRRKKTGEQANMAKKYANFMESYNQDPTKALTPFVENAGLSLAKSGADNKAALLDKVLAHLEADSPEDAKQLLKGAAESTSKPLVDPVIQKRLANLETRAVNAEMSRKYKDWDERREDREVMLMSLKAGDVSIQEMAHAAAFVGQVKGIKEAEYTRGYEQAKKDIGDKKQHGGGAGGGADGSRDGKKRTGEELMSQIAVAADQGSRSMAHVKSTG